MMSVLLLFHHWRKIRRNKKLLWIQKIFFRGAGRSPIELAELYAWNGWVMQGSIRQCYDEKCWQTWNWHFYEHVQIVGVIVIASAHEIYMLQHQLLTMVSHYFLMLNPGNSLLLCLLIYNQGICMPCSSFSAGAHVEGLLPERWMVIWMWRSSRSLLGRA